jgi:hypothetical protein
VKIIKAKQSILILLILFNIGYLQEQNGITFYLNPVAGSEAATIGAGLFK